MLGSKLTVSEDTRVYKDLTKTEKAKIKLNRLKEADLSTPMTRKDVAVLGGYQYGDPKGTSWVSNLVKRGYLTEVFSSKNKQTVTNLYFLTNKEVGKRKSSRRKPVVKPITEPVVLARAYTPTEKTKVVVEFNGMTITIENAGANYVGEIIKAIK